MDLEARRGWCVLTHVTSAKIALKALLEAQLPIVLAQADADADDGVTTPLPYEINRSDKTAAGGYPAIELIATGSIPQQDSFAQIMRHRVAVGVTVTGDDQETLTVWVERYLWAIRRIARDSLLAPTSLTGPIDSGVEEYSPLGSMDRSTENPFVKAGYIELFLTTVE